MLVTAGREMNVAGVEPALWTDPPLPAPFVVRRRIRGHELQQRAFSPPAPFTFKYEHHCQAWGGRRDFNHSSEDTRSDKLGLRQNEECP